MKPEEERLQFLQQWTPPGISAREECRWIRNGLVISLLFSLLFFSRYYGAYRSLFLYLENGSKILLEEKTMPPYVQILGMCLAGFLVIALCMLPLAVYHYAYHYQGAKSIYLMKRLPCRAELWRRCLLIPASGVAAALASALILLLLYGVFYRIVTPEACLLQDWLWG